MRNASAPRCCDPVASPVHQYLHVMPQVAAWKLQEAMRLLSGRLPLRAAARGSRIRSAYHIALQRPDAAHH